MSTKQLHGSDRCHSAPIISFLSWILLTTYFQMSHSASHFCYNRDDLHCGPYSNGWSPTCHSGRAQSPINIPFTAPSQWHLPKAGASIWFNEAYKRGVNRAFISNNGHSVRVSITEDLTSTMIVQSSLYPDPYIFGQVHCHWDSEHLFKSRRFPLECHFVHYNANYENINKALESNQTGSLLIFAILYQPLGPTRWFHNPTMEGFTNNLKLVRTPGHVNVEIAGQLNIYQMLANQLHVGQYGGGPVGRRRRISTRIDAHSYTGSLTIPHCNEGMNWLVLRRRQFLSTNQMQQFRMVMDAHDEKMSGNFRDVQPLNGRIITPVRLRVSTAS